jgi:hypothetical protein
MVPPAESVAKLDGFSDPGLKTSRVEIYVCEAGKRCLAGETVDCFIFNSDFASFHRDDGQTLEGVGKQVLQGSYIFRLATDADFLTADSFCRLFTLITEHGNSSHCDFWFGAHLQTRCSIEC